MSDKPKDLHFFSPARIALSKEVAHNWPTIGKELANNPEAEWPEQIGIIAGCCNIMMNGEYTNEDLDNLADKLYWKLNLMRKGIATPNIGIPVSQIKH